MSLPDDFLRSLPTGSRNPFRRLAYAAFRAFFDRLARPREVRYEGGRIWMRESPSEDWPEVPDVEPDGRPSANNPAWVVGLLRSPPAAVTARSEQAGELQLTLDLDAVEHDLRISISDAGVPTRLAVSTGNYTDTGEPGWSVLEFTSYGVAFDGVDLWREWEEAR